MSKKTDYKQLYKRCRKKNTELSNDLRITEKAFQSQAVIIKCLVEQLEDNNIKPNPKYDRNTDKSN